MRASLSLDLDNKWSYMKTHGDAGWRSMPSYLDIVVPRALDLFDRLQLRMTFFIVGQDAAMPQHAEVLGEIPRRGHEIGNHSHYHEPWMHRRDDAAIEDELALAEESIERATGVRPRGFRGPGFVRSQSLLETLVRRGYTYDASSLPTFIGPLARAYYFRSTKLTDDDRSRRVDLFGKFGDGFRPNRPHRIATSAGSIAEIPVTTFPVFRIPIHVSYLLYIAAISPKAALAYFRAALAACKLTKTEPSILLHPLDFIGGVEAPELRFFPAMQMDAKTKRHVLEESLRMLGESFVVRPLREVAAAVSSDEGLSSLASEARTNGGL